MGGGSWTAKNYISYSNALGRTTALNTTGTTILDSSLNAFQIYKSTRLDSMLNPLNVTRECLDSDEHFKIVTLDNLSKTISDIIINSQTTEFLVNSTEDSSTVENVDGISW